MKQKEIDSILSKSKNKEWIAFDCFDTLIERKYSINYVFYRLSGFLLRQYDFRESQEQLFLSLQRIFNRCNLPFESLVRDLYLHYKEEITDDFQKFFIDLKKEFIQAEVENALPTKGSKNLLYKLKEDGKLICVISDFYIGKEFLKELLEKIFGKDIFDEIFVSSDFNKEKVNGSLFSLLPSKNILMVGDNIKSDFTIPSKLGFECIHIDSDSSYRRYKRYDDNYQKNVFKEFKRITDKKGKGFTSNYGFILYLCLRKLYRKLSENDCVYFLARDGLFLKKCFDSLLAKENKKNIQTIYLPISRLALMIPSMEIGTFDFQKAIEKRTPWPILSNDSFLRCLGFYPSEREKIIHECGNQSYDSSKEYFESKEYSDLIYNPQFQNKIGEIRDESKTKFIHLFDKNKNNHIITMDLGWQGTSQNDMKKVLGDDVLLTGYYIGTTNCIGELKGSEKIGLWFDYLNDTSVEDSSFYDFEALLKNDKKQLICYRKEEDIYMEDSSPIVYEEFSKRNQNIAFQIFEELITLDFMIPFSDEDIKKWFDNIRKKESFKDIFNGFYYYYLQDGGDESKQSKKNILMQSLNLYFLRKNFLLRNLFCFIKKLAKRILK